MMPVTPVAARTRSHRSRGPPSAKSRIPTRSTRRNPLAARATVAAEPSLKRKGSIQVDEVDMRKRPVSSWLQTHAAATPHKAPAERNVPSTPQRQTSQPSFDHPPTPARDILSGAEAAVVILRPPTPPRIAERTPRNGYPAIKRPHTPEADGRVVAQRLGFGSVARSRPVQQKLFFTPQPQRHDSSSKPIVGSRKLFTPQPNTRALSRPIAPLPLRKLQPVAEIQKLRTSPAFAAISPAPMIRLNPPVDEIDFDVAPRSPRLGAGLAPSLLPATGENEMEVEVAPSSHGRVADAEQETLHEESQMLMEISSPVPAPSFASSIQTDARATEVTSCLDSGSPSRAHRRPPTIVSTLPVRRPSTRPSAAEPPQLAPMSASHLGTTVSGTPGLRRQPSYPSSLGTGPLSRPTPRVVSNPVTRSASNPVPATNSLDVDPPAVRAVSDPPLRSVSASHGTDPSRRQSFADTSRNLSALNDALAKLRLPGPSTDSVRPRLVRKTPVSSVSTSSSASHTPVSGVSRPRNLASSVRPSLASLPVRAVNRTVVSASDADQHPVKDEKNSGAYNRSFAALVAAQKGGSFLKGVVAYVDVRNEDGDDTGATFADMLRNCGAKVVTRPTESCTHFIYKSGKPATSAFWRKMPSDRRPHVVGLRWVTRTLEGGRRAPEDEHRVDFGGDDLFQKRRRSMEPCSQPSRHSRASGRSARLPSIPDGQQYAPKVGSPLKKVHSLR